MKVAHLVTPALFIVTVVLSASSFEANATPAFAQKEKKSCNYCHLKNEGGKGWGFRGKYYEHNKLSFKGFVEKTEAAKAGVKPGAMGAAAKPTKKYP